MAFWEARASGNSDEFPINSDEFPGNSDEFPGMRGLHSAQASDSRAREHVGALASCPFTTTKSLATFGNPDGFPSLLSVDFRPNSA